jgi:anti-sigma factor ChrR (cupin superfamily)
MKHNSALDEMGEMVALYALGALTQREARAFEEHLSEGCEACRKELEAFEQTVDALAFGAAEQVPPPSVRDRLLAAVSDDKRGREAEAVSPKPVAQAFVSLRAAEGEWTEAQEGIFIKPLYVDEASGLATSLVKMMPGTTLPAHQHKGVEQFFIIEGDCNLRGEALGPGDYHRAAAGTVHEATHTIHGTMFLLVAPVDYVVWGPQ